MSDMFGHQPLLWQDHYDGMPEYNNEKEPDPEIVAKFKFKSQHDFDLFCKVVKDSLYEGQRIFDGNQRVNDYQAWFPLPPRPSAFKIISTDEN
jgi:hypothetical protein